MTDKRIQAFATVSAFHRFNTDWHGKEMSTDEKEAWLNAIGEQ